MGQAFSGYTDPSSPSYLSSPLAPACVAGFLGLALANAVLSVYEASVDTLMLCYCEDRRMHGGRAAFAPPVLCAVLGAADPVRAPGPGQAGRRTVTDVTVESQALGLDASSASRL